jgi:uncharacterized membrane protein
MDIPWLLLVQTWAADMVRSIQIKPMTMRWWAAPIVYLALGFLLHYPRSVYEAFMMGLSIYAVYDFTNYATFEKYEPAFALADTLWGGTLFASAYFMKGYLSKWI